MKNASSTAREAELLREIQEGESAEEAQLLEPVDGRLHNVQGMWGRLFDDAVKAHPDDLSPRGPWTPR